MSQRFQAGSKVYSAQLGAGEVLSVEGYGDKEKLTIRFDNSGVRQILSRFFVLEPFDNQLHVPAEPPPSPPSPSRHAAPESASPIPAPTHSVAVQRPSGGAGTPGEGSFRSGVARAGAEAPSLREIVREVLREEIGFGETRMMDRWRGGTMILRPGRAGTQERSIPIDAFFHKIVMLRDRLRVLEQKVNAHPGFSDAEKVELQQYVTRVYGTLTTFNVLFAEREDWFVGQKGSED